MNKVVVVILNYKVVDLTVKCIQSVLKSNHKSLAVVVIDNNSEDDVEGKVKKFKDLIFIQSGDNLGYAGGNNIGIRKALEMGADFVFVLNPDTTILKDTIGNLIQGLERYSAEVANPKIYFANSKILWFAGKIFDRANVLGLHRGVDQKDQGQYDKPSEMVDVTGAALMIKREVFERIGFFDERYFLYYEESDFGHRVHQAGFKIMYLPQAIVYHANAKSTGLGTPLQDYFITRNRMLYARKFLSLRTQFALLREAWRHRGTPARRFALQDFLMGKFGKGSFLK